MRPLRRGGDRESLDGERRREMDRDLVLDRELYDRERLRDRESWRDLDGEGILGR